MFVQTTTTGERTLNVRRLKIQAEAHFTMADFHAERADAMRNRALDEATGGDDAIARGFMGAALMRDTSADVEVANAERLLDRARAIKTGSSTTTKER